MSALAPAPARAPRPRQHRLARLAAGVGVAAAVALVAGCGGSSSSGAGSSAGLASDAGVAASASAAAPAPEQPAAGSGPAFGDAGSAAGNKAAAGGAGAAASVSVGASIIRTAEVTVEVKNLEDLRVAAERVRAVADSLGGYVSSETTGFSSPATPPPGANGSDPSAPAGAGSDTATSVPGEGVIVLRVPQASLGAALQRVTAVGHEVSRTSSSQDVTGDIADLASRVETARASVARVRALMSQARSLTDIVTLESELSRRESDLEAVEARRAALSDRADLATLTVVLRTPDVVVKVATQSKKGFLAGLSDGWQALKDSTVAVLTVVGYLLPVAIAVGLLGWPAVVFARRRSALLAQKRAAAWPVAQPGVWSQPVPQPAWVDPRHAPGVPTGQPGPTQVAPAAGPGQPAQAGPPAAGGGSVTALLEADEAAADDEPGV